MGKPARFGLPAATRRNTTETVFDRAGPHGLTERKRQHRAFVVARIILVVLFIGLWCTLTPLGYRMPYGFLAALVAEACMLLVCLRAISLVERPRALDIIHGVLLVGELGCHSAMFYYLGGVSWLGSIAFFFGIIYATVFMSWRQAAVFSALVSAVYIGILTLDATGVLPHQVYLPQGPDRYKDTQFLVPTAVGFTGVMGTIAFWMVFLGGEMRRERDIAVRAYDELARAQAELRNLNEELENKVAERTKVLSFRAEHDTLTGLLNRGSVSRRCQEALALAGRSGQRVSVIIADGDNFKACNDNVGHEHGDAMIRTIAQVLRDGSRECDYVGRQGGDEFLIVLPNTAAAGASRYCRRIIRKLERAHAAADPALPFPMLSMGIAVFPMHGDQIDDLIRVADHAMYEAKAAGGACWRVGPDVKPEAEAARRHSRAAARRAG